MSNILVTGGAGFIGSVLVKRLIENNYNVTVVDNLTHGKKENVDSKAEFINVDILDNLSDIFKNKKFKYVFHLAAQIDLRKSLEDPINDAKINILGSLNLIDLCVKHNVEKFIFSSSSAVYGVSDNLPCIEECKLKPSSGYGISKMTIENYLEIYNKLYGLKYIALRYSNVYGSSQMVKGGGVVSVFFNFFLNKKPTVISGGEQTRDFVYVEDVVRANLLCIKFLNKVGIYNVGTAEETSINQLYEIIQELFFSKKECKKNDFNTAEVLRSSLNYTKIKKDLGWEPKYTLKNGLKHMIKFC